MPKLTIVHLLGTLLCVISFQTFAQTDTTESHLFKPDIDEVMNAKTKVQGEENISVASFRQTNIRETPGIVTLITKEEIENSGARDLIDLLRLVPGLNFSHNYESAIGIAVRGNWAEEGKFLLLLDGQVMNETSFGTLVFGQRIPLHNIERIEIIRGAGSAKYGGLAELCVINIITQGAAELNGLKINSNIGYSGQGISRRSLQVSTSQIYKNDVSLSLSGFTNIGNRSNLLGNNPQGQEVSYLDSTGIVTTQLNFGFNYKDLDVRFIYSNYEYKTLFNDFNVMFRDYLGSVSYNARISDKVSLTPRFSWKQQQPWWYQDYQLSPLAAIYDGYRTLNNRYTAELISNIIFTDNLALAVGSEFFTDIARYKVKDFTFFNEQDQISFTNIALFAELSYNSRIANVTLGARVDDHSAVEAAFVPRVAITKAFDQLHFKALYSGSFKAPTIQNIQFSPNNEIGPERTRILEFETGYKFNDNFSINANIFDVRIDDPIIYFIDRATAVEGYSNVNETGSQGVELEARWKGKWGYFTTNYSFYRPQYSEVADYQLVESSGEIDENAYLGIPTHKITANAHFKIRGNFSINPVLMYFSEKQTYLFFPDATDAILTKFDPEVHFNLNLRYNNLFTKGLTGSIGVYNLLGQEHWLINAYNSGDNPMPEQGREILFRLTYQVGAIR